MSSADQSKVNLKPCLKPCLKPAETRFLNLRAEVRPAEAGTARMLREAPKGVKTTPGRSCSNPDRIRKMFAVYCEADFDRNIFDPDAGPEITYADTTPESRLRQQERP
jgi:hypothetical protein